ncbi:hypothetical protein CEQ90_13065 [Lewinellaceae bacterium SD302]|nr:hypothetical protein CEQ90_13065 [Lewinellaceae bacterium SD302]
MPSPFVDPRTAFRAGRFPLVAPAIAFGVGILVAACCGYPKLTSGWWASVLLAVLLLFMVLRTWKEPVVRRRLGYLIVLLFSLAGYWCSTLHHPPNHSPFFVEALPATGTATLLVQIKSVRPGEKSIRLETEVEMLVSDSLRKPVSGKLLLYLPVNERVAALNFGDRILFAGRPEQISPPLNPHAFDAASYWAGKGIFHRLFVRENEAWQLTRKARPGLRAWATTLRESWLNSFRDHLVGNELAVAAALVLGKKDLLTEDLRSAYADTGAVHVLAVSGLHVGIVSLLFSGLLGLFPWRGLWWRIIKVGLTIAGIWGFAILTGGSASVLRAAAMFSVLAAGGLGRRKTHLFNLLGFAALAILLVDPRQIFQVGFQLSFAAVAGIGLFQKWLAGLLFSRFRWVNKITAALSVSLAATLGTLPFCLYYFHQFPLYFLLTGTVVVYSAFAILLTGILHGFISLAFSKLSFLTGAVLNFFVELQNAVVFWGRQLPGARQETAWISSWEFGLLLLSIVIFGWWLRRRDFNSLAAVLICLLGLSFFGWQSSKVRKEQRRTVVYNQGNGRVIDIVSGNRALRLISPEVDPEKLRYTAENHQSARGYRIDTTLYLPAAKTYELPGVATVVGNLLFTAQGSWLIENAYSTETEMIEVDFILPHNFSEKGAAEPAKSWVIDGKTRYYTRDEMLEGAVDSTTSKFHFTAKDGAFIAE